jgi:hypothetical protein
MVGGSVAKTAIPKATEMYARINEATHNKGYDLRAAQRLIEVYGGSDK